MRLDIHHYHHQDAEVLKKLSQILQVVLPVERKLELIQEQINFMANEEQQLNEGISQLRDATVEGFQSVNKAVEKAAQRVIQRLEENDADLSDEIQILREMKSAVRTSTDEAVTRLDKIAQPKIDADPPKEDTPPFNPDASPADASGLNASAGETTGDTTGSVENQTTGSEIADANEPFDPNPDAQNETSGFDDQERTPVPHPER